VHAQHSSMRMMMVQRNLWKLALSGDRLVFNAGEVTGNVYTAMLPD